MKKLLTYAILACALVSCAELSDKVGDLSNGITITLRPAATVTKAGDITSTDGTGVDALNENKVTSLSYWFYANETSNTVLVSGNMTFDTPLQISEPTTIPLDITEAQFDQIFSGRTTARLFAVANVAASSFTGKTSRADINAVALTVQNGGKKQSTFAMSGEGTVTKNTTTTNRVASGSVSLTRAIAKITLNIKLAHSYSIYYDEGGEVIPGGTEVTTEIPLDDDYDPELPTGIEKGIVNTPLYSQMTYTLHNGAEDGVVGGSAVATSDRFTTDTLKYFVEPEYVANEPYLFNGLTNPMYTYARTWEQYQPSGASGDTQPYLLIMLPWKTTTFEDGEQVGQAVYQNTWYKMVFNSNNFEANAWYNIVLSLNGLGSLTNGEPQVIEPLEFNIYDWKPSLEVSTAFNTVVVIGDDEYRVLDIPRDELVLYNITTASIPYYSSHPCSIVSVVQSKPNYSSRNTTITTTNVTSSGYVTIDNTNNTINFNHTLNNDFTSSNFDYVPYTYTITIKHTDDASYTDVVTIVQYPAMYIVAEASTPAQNNDDKPRYLFVNKNTAAASAWYTVEGVDATSNNKNMYVISVSQFGEGSQMHIADPRSMTAKTNDQLAITGSGYAGRQTDAAGRTLTYYYQTNTDKSHEYEVAPKFRFCSAYGQLGSNSMTLENAVKRCATYQEEGYPAGRWRLPSTGELLFIANICAKGLIPPLFSSGMDYWTATGAYTYSQSGGGSVRERSYSSSTRLFCRCVYDEWYWENSEVMPTCDKGTFTWGDMERSNFR